MEMTPAMAANDAKKPREVTKRYQNLNAEWPPGAFTQKASDAEVRRAAKVLFKEVFGRPLPKRVKIVTKHKGRSHVYFFTSVYGINATPAEFVGNGFKGWGNVVHDWSHAFHRMLHPKEKPHGPHQAFIEAQMIKAVVDRGWLKTPLAKAPKGKPSRDAVRLKKLAAVEAAIKKWERKAKLAKTKLGKLAKKKKYYEKPLAELPPTKPRKPRKPRLSLKQLCELLAKTLRVEIAVDDIHKGQHYVGNSNFLTEDQDPYAVEGHYVDGWTGVMEHLKEYEKAVYDADREKNPDPVSDDEKDAWHS